jgi:hypothetical protein
LVASNVYRCSLCPFAFSFLFFIFVVFVFLIVIIVVIIVVVVIVGVSEGKFNSAQITKVFRSICRLLDSLITLTFKRRLVYHGS